MPDKIFRPALLIILAAILIAQIFAVIPSVQCRKVSSEILIQLVSTLENYQSDIYENPKVDNINKQMLVSNEYQFVLLTYIAELNAACK